MALVNIPGQADAHPFSFLEPTEISWGSLQQPTDSSFDKPHLTTQITTHADGVFAGSLFAAGSIGANGKRSFGVSLDTSFLTDKYVHIVLSAHGYAGDPAVEVSCHAASISALSTSTEVKPHYSWGGQGSGLSVNAQELIYIRNQAGHGYAGLWATFTNQSGSSIAGSFVLNVSMVTSHLPYPEVSDVNSA